MVNSVSLDCSAGEIVGLIGPNGSGKTTLLNRISPLWISMRERLPLTGRAVHNIGPRRTAIGGIARTFQNIRLFTNLTVRQNIEVAFTTARCHRLCLACCFASAAGFRRTFVIISRSRQAA